MRKVFTDTSALLALIIKEDKFNKNASGFINQKPNLITSSWVIEEFIAHLHARYGTRKAKKGIEMLDNFPGLEIVFLNKELLKVTNSHFLKYGSIRVSLVDTSNVVLMKDLQIKTIFSFDSQFESIFKLKVVPEL